MSKSKTNWSMAMMFAGTYIATLIGSGYATGQEIFQFFVSYGPAGIISGLIALVVFVYAGVELLYRGYKYQADDPGEMFRYYCGDKFGTLLEHIVPFYLFAIYIIMVSGAGATLEEYYGLNPYVGRVLMSGLAFVSVIFGLSRMVQILGNIGPVIIVFTIGVCVYNIFIHYGNLDQAIAVYNTVEVAKPASNSIVAGLLYPSYNMLSILGLLSSIGATAKSEKDAIWGGIIGGLGVAVTLIVMYMAMMVQFGDIYELTIPTLYMADQISPLVGQLFSIILILGIYSSAVPMLWQSVNRIVPDDSPNFKLVVLAATVLGFLLGLLPFDVLVGTIYPYVGYIGLVTLALMVIKTISERAKSN